MTWEGSKGEKTDWCAWRHNLRPRAEGVVVLVVIGRYL